LGEISQLGKKKKEGAKRYNLRIFFKKLGSSHHIMKGKIIFFSRFKRMGSNKLPNYGRNPKIFYFSSLTKFG